MINTIVIMIMIDNNSYNKNIKNELIIHILNII
jgi:hypothetical protein